MVAGDVVEAQGFVGSIVEIQVFNTIIRTLDNQRVIIPNALLSNGCVKNIFTESARRVDMIFGISYSDDLAKAKSVLKQVTEDNDMLLKDPAARCSSLRTERPVTMLAACRT